MRAETLSRPLRVLDVCTGGAGGWSLGLHRAGPFDTVAMAESEPERRHCLSHNFPSVKKIYDDIAAVTATRLRADGITGIDVLVGSPPCQDGSRANQKGKGVEGERTKLVFEMPRLARELRPLLIGFENSDFLIYRGGDRVFDELDAEGFTLCPLVLPANAFGAPHERKRLYLIGWNADEIRRQAGRLGKLCAGAGAGAVARSRSRNRPPSTIEGRDAAQEQARLLRQSRRPVRDDAAGDGDHRCPWGRDWLAGIGDHARGFDGVSSGMARLAAEMYGDAVLPQITEAVGRGFLAVIKAAIAQGEATKTRRRDHRTKRNEASHG